MRWPLALTVCLLAGCIEPFEGSHVQFTLQGVLPPCQVLLLNKLPGDVHCRKGGQALTPKEQRFVYHYEMWATVNRSATVYLMSFTVQPHLFPDEQLELDKQKVLLSSGDVFKVGGDRSYWDDMTDAERATTDTQMAKASGVYAITSFSFQQFEPDGGRLADPFYLGNHGQLSRSHNGTYYGQVQASHPFGAITLSGASVRVAPNLKNLDSMWITIEREDPNRPDPQPNSLIYIQGSAAQTVRGVINVKATSPVDPNARAEFGVMPSLGEEDYF
jgi:hypothetical protein